MNAPKRLIALSFMAVALATAGCPEKGPLEKAGDKVEDVFDKDGPLEKAGEKIDEAAEDVEEAFE